MVYSLFSFEFDAEKIITKISVAVADGETKVKQKQQLVVILTTLTIVGLQWSKR